ncbi:putative proline-rich receptor-like protein kinase PERK3 [Iris pallida]|uniref:Proline-rich receptor-like protein kinase PERK3 n=1 Tax=Iris pallida TaxID=29817 RepID=A0AAX6GPP1_IRIPA|nr:putative proline-rich receptor-like protein kinase PERK3 [Iris pallida]KAJ6841346.1 putative proline-rich receptor-like protein kinase PERK3 [Iris pallida]
MVGGCRRRTRLSGSRGGSDLESNSGGGSGGKVLETASEGGDPLEFWRKGRISRNTKVVGGMALEKQGSTVEELYSQGRDAQEAKAIVWSERPRLAEVVVDDLGTVGTTQGSGVVGSARSRSGSWRDLDPPDRTGG